MGKKIFVSILSVIFVSSASLAEDLVICNEETKVYAQDLKTTLFSGHKYETVALFQGFEENETSEYSRVEFTSRVGGDLENNVGWVNKADIQLESRCAEVLPLIPESPMQRSSSMDIGSSLVTSLTSDECCLFPFKKKPTASMDGGMRAFGGRRDGGARAHAAADLYQAQYFPVYAIADGEIIRDRVPFYLGTNVTEIRHPGGFVARYGEMASSTVKPLKLGNHVKAGQLIGYIKHVNSKKVPSAMLHFELYTGKGSGAFTTTTGKFERRSDLINPTAYLTKWMKNL